MKALNFSLKTWLFWLLIQGIIQAFWFHQWLIGLLYGAHFYGFSQLAKEVDVTKFNQRLLFWLKIFLIFFYGKGLLFIYGNSVSLLVGDYSPSKLIGSLISLGLECFWLIRLKQAQKETEPSKTQQVLIDEKTGEILKEMA